MLASVALGAMESLGAQKYMAGMASADPDRVYAGPCYHMARPSDLLVLDFC